MNKEDKEKLIVLGILIVMVAIAAVFIVGTKNLPYRYIFLVVVLAQFLVVIPKVVELFYKVHDADSSLTRFIPLYSELTIFTEKFAKINIISFIFLLISVGMFFIPSSTVASVLGDSFAMSYGLYMIRFVAITAIIFDIVNSLAWCNVNRRVQIIELEYSNTSGSMQSIISYVIGDILFFIPIIRVIPQTLTWNNLNGLVKLNGINTNIKKVDLEEENGEL